MIFFQRPAGSLEQFAQSFRGNTVVKNSADGQIRPQLALVLTEFTRQSNRGLQAAALHVRMDEVEIL
jgi:hypothetical protein